jgi:hypothetical protein
MKEGNDDEGQAIGNLQAFHGNPHRNGKYGGSELSEFRIQNS